MPTLKVNIDRAHPPVIVGEDNPYGGWPPNALLPEPKNSAGWRLCVKVMRMDPRIYLRVFLRYNLCTGKWWRDEALNRAEALRALYPTSHFILLGSKVANAFGLKYEPFVVHGELLSHHHGELLKNMIHVKTLILPHPSGRCRVWNEPESYDRALAGVKELIHG